MGRQREEWLSLVDDLNRRIKSLDAWLDERARRDERVMRLQTHPGIGLLTSMIDRAAGADVRRRRWRAKDFAERVSCGPGARSGW